MENNNDKIYLFVPYSEKDSARALGAKWDKDCKKWYSLESNPYKDVLIAKYGKEGICSKCGK